MHASTPAALKDLSSPAHDVRSRIGTLVADRYRILRMIGEGGMGAVFEAEALHSGERVAVKLIKPEYATSSEVTGRFLQEVRAVSAVGHPNIVRLLDAGTDAYGPFMVLELLEGETLCDVLDRRPLGPREALSIMAATLDALQAAHTAGVVHRDIKPENIFLMGGAERCAGVKLLDFGISKIISMQSATGGITRVGTAVGTPDYMSPEQAGGGRVDGRADLWSVGAVLYEAITLAHPFEGESYQQLISNIVLHAHKPLRERVPAAPREVEAFIDRALRKEPGDRYPSAAAMHAEAQHLLAALPSDEALGFRHDEPTSVMRAAPNEPTQVIEVSPSAAASAAARPQRPPRHAPPTHAPPAHAPPAHAPPPQQLHPQSLPPPAWRDAPESATLVDAPAHGAAVTAGNDERSVSRNAITVVAVIAGVLVFGALAVRIRSVTLHQEADVAMAPAPQPAPAPAPVAQVLAQPAAQVLAHPAAQVLAQPAARVVAQPAARVVAQPAAPRAPAPTPRALERPSPRRVVAPAPAAGSTDSRMAVLRLALPSLRACAAGPPRYPGNVDATVFFDVRGRVRTTQLRAPSPVTVHGACIRRALGQLVVPGAANSAVPMFYTFN